MATTFELRKTHKTTTPAKHVQRGRRRRAHTRGASVACPIVYYRTMGAGASTPLLTIGADAAIDGLGASREQAPFDPTSPQHASTEASPTDTDAAFTGLFLKHAPGSFIQGCR